MSESVQTQLKAQSSIMSQSPPLESTESHQPMGKSNLQGDVSEGVTDAEQRKQYFDKSQERGATDVGTGAKDEIKSATKTAAKSAANMDRNMQENIGK